MAASKDDRLIGMIRQRTEEEELTKHLRPTVGGGYSKTSVMEYLAELRKRQQCSSETFNENMQSLLEEKETLKSENEKLLMQIAQAKAEFQRMAETRKQHELIRDEAPAEEPVPGKHHDLNKAEAQSGNIVYLNRGTPEDGAPPRNDGPAEAMLEALKKELEKAHQELKAQKELLAMEKLEAKNQRDLVTELTGVVEELEEELQNAKGSLSAERRAEYEALLAGLEEKNTGLETRCAALEKLNAELQARGDTLVRQNAETKDHLSELTAGIEEQDGVIARLKAQAAEKESTYMALLDENVTMMKSIEQLTNAMAEKDDTIKTLLDENVTMMRSMDLMSNSLDVMEIQNEKLMTANSALEEAYGEESRKVVKLLNRISEETVEKRVLARKLEDARAEKTAGAPAEQSGAAKDPESKTSIA